MVYHTIVKSLVRKNFERVNARDFPAILADVKPNIKHRFGGNHALGGERNTKEAFGRWLERLAIVAPGLKLQIRDIWVKGWPQDTTVFVRWTASDRFPDGSPYNNHGIHMVKLSWGKVVEIDANEDSQVVDKMMKAQAAAGVKEAAMPMIES